MTTRRLLPPRALVLVLVLVSGVVACGEDDEGAGSGGPVGRDRASDTGTTTGAAEAAPSGDFYMPPTPLPEGAAGELIRSEPIDTPSPVRAWRILYHSRAVDGSDIAVSGTVLAPVGDAPAEERPVQAIGLGSSGIADQCSPSRTPEPMLSSPGILAYVAAGRVVAITDYAGLGTPDVHPYGSGESAGRAVLDAARAARQLPDAHAGARVALGGYSQGGHAVLFGAELAPSYAPELDVVGVVAVAPMLDLVALMHNASSLPAGLGGALMFVRGLSAAYPEADPALVLTEQGKAALPTVDAQCYEQLAATFSTTEPQDLFTADPSVVDGWRDALERNTPAPGRIDVPILVLKGDADEILPKTFTDTYVAGLCAAGDPVDYRVYPGANHTTVLPASAADLEAWVAERFTGTPAATTCAPTAK
jgi:pimeloyl-ACP methyl ester carboxylesterase